MSTQTMANRSISEHFSEGRPLLDSHALAVLKCAEHLLPDERILIELIVQAKLSRVRTAQVLGVPCGTISRRLNRIAQRIFNPLAMALIDPRCPLPATPREIAIGHFVRHESIRDIARLRQIPVMKVHTAIAFVRGWHRGATVAVGPENGEELFDPARFSALSLRLRKPRRSAQPLVATG